MDKDKSFCNKISLSIKTYNSLIEIGWLNPKESKKSEEMLNLCEAAMKVNYGPKGICRPGLIIDNETLEKIIMTVINFYEEQLKI